MRISDWSSDVCSSDLKDHPVKSQGGQGSGRKRALRHVTRVRKGNATPCKIKIGRLADLFKASRSDFWQHSGKIGRESCRERVCQYVYISVVAGSLKTNIKLDLRTDTILYNKYT